MEANHYREEIKALCSDPIVQGLARELERDGVKRESIADGMDPHWGFMQGALSEYKRRGGQGAHSVGGVAKALLALISQR